MSTWVYDKQSHTLTCKAGGYPYWINLLEVVTAAEVFDWLAHISEKTWATDKVIADLVRAFDERVKGLRFA